MGDTKTDPNASATVVGVRLNTNAPDFAVEDDAGRNVSLRDFTNSIVVLEWFDPLCEYTQRDYKARTPQKLEAKYRDKGVVWLAVNSARDSTRDHNRAWAQANELKARVLDDARKRISAAYGVKTVPCFVIIDRHGKVVYTGAIDDDESRNPEPREGSIEYVDRALGQLVEGKAVDRPVTRVFGCPLK